MVFDHGLKPLDAISNEKLMQIFKCSARGGMRRSLKTNTLILISDYTKSIYEDRWIGNVFHYTGMGQEGDQSINFAQNKTLAQPPSTKISVYLFEVFEPKKLVYRGEVRLSGKPYQELQPDIHNRMRQAWIFPLTLTEEDTSKIPLPETMISEKQRRKEREASRLDDQELLRRAKNVRKGVGTRQVQRREAERNAYVAEYSKRRASGKCQLCESPAPFIDTNGQPFLEVHHIIWLSEGGEDQIENTVALCPNCHRKMHILNIKTDQEILKEKAKQGES